MDLRKIELANALIIVTAPLRWESGGVSLCFGRDPYYLGERLLPYVKSGGRIYLSIPGMVRDCHDALPACLLASWDAGQLEYIHDLTWWRDVISQTSGVVIEDMHQMACTSEAWADLIT